MNVMSQAIKLSDSLISQARSATKGRERSVAGQVEFWAQMGQAIEPLLSDTQAASLRRRPANSPFFNGLRTVDSPAGHRRVKKFLKSQAFPHYEPYTKKAGLLVRIEADGSRMIGKFVGRHFHPVAVKVARQ